MGISRKLNRCAAWIACLAILLAAFAPSISYALSAKKAGFDAMHEICTASGIQATGAQQQSGHDTPSEKAGHGTHCGLCLTSAFSFGPPPAPVTLPQASLEQSFPSLFYVSIQPLFAWAAPQSRAPPIPA